MVSPRCIYNSLSILVPVSYFSCSLVAVRITLWLLPCSLVVPLFLLLIRHRLRCPACGKIIGWYKVAWLDNGAEWWHFFVGRHCSHCGHNLAIQQPLRALFGNKAS
jgi:hypothetical protein